MQDAGFFLRETAVNRVSNDQTPQCENSKQCIEVIVNVEALDEKEILVPLDSFHENGYKMTQNEEDQSRALPMQGKETETDSSVP